MANLKLPDLTPVQIRGLAAAIPAEAAAVGIPLPATVKAVLAAAVPVAYAAAVIADAIIRHGRASALPTLIAQQAEQVAQDTHDETITKIAADVEALAGRVSGAEDAVKAAGQPIDVQDIAEQVLTTLAVRTATAVAAHAAPAPGASAPAAPPADTAPAESPPADQPPPPPPTAAS